MCVMQGSLKWISPQLWTDTGACEHEAIHARLKSDHIKLRLWKQETADHISVRKDTRSRVDTLTGDPALRCNNMPPRNRGHGYVPKT